MKLIYSLSAMSLLAIGLAGCSSSADIQAPGASPDQTQLTEQQLSKKLHADGVAVIPQGQQIDFVIPVNKFFTDNSTQIKQQQQVDFKYMAELIQAKGPATPIVITGYTNKTGTPSEQKARAQAHAEVIAAYLWNQGIDSQQMKVDSAGSSDPIAYDDTTAGDQANRRIVVAVNHPE